MLTKYIQAALHRASYKILPDDGTFFGEIPGFQGVWANADTRLPRRTGRGFRRLDFTASFSEFAFTRC